MPLPSAAVAALCLLAAPGLHPQSAPAPPVHLGISPGNVPLHGATWDPPARYAKIDQLLRNADWPAAELEARAAIGEDLKEKISYLAPLLGLLAVAEAGRNHADDALWHWQVALAI